MFVLLLAGIRVAREESYTAVLSSGELGYTIRVESLALSKYSVRTLLSRYVRGLQSCCLTCNWKVTARGAARRIWLLAGEAIILVASIFKGYRRD